MTRTFEASAAVRAQVPLLVGLFGPSGSGKTFSALRLATGIQTVTGGDIYFIDTEAKRALHYADDFRFKHVPFVAPFGSLDYLEVMRWSVAQGARIVVVDSASHEHEGEGGYLSTHAKEVERMAGGDAAKAERVKMAGWIKPAAQRRAFINGMLQLNANFIFCFRAKEKTKPVKGGGILELGFMAIAGDELLYEMTVNALLMPRANGVPTWSSEQVGERLLMKLPGQFRSLFAESKALSEDHGVAMAEWARGGLSSQKTQATGIPITERADALMNALKAAKTKASLQATWTGSKAQEIRGQLEATLDSRRLDQLTHIFETRLSELGAAR